MVWKLIRKTHHVIPGADIAERQHQIDENLILRYLQVSEGLPDVPQCRKSFFIGRLGASVRELFPKFLRMLYLVLKYLRDFVRQVYRGEFRDKLEDRAVFGSCDANCSF